jgi:hypothetical protein
MGIARGCSLTPRDSPTKIALALGLCRRMSGEWQN